MIRRTIQAMMDINSILTQLILILNQYDGFLKKIKKKKLQKKKKTTNILYIRHVNIIFRNYFFFKKIFLIIYIYIHIYTKFSLTLNMKIS
jgi:hypothetical protein